MPAPVTGPRLGLVLGLLAAAWATSLALAGDLQSVSPVATRALGVLDRHCAGCHQSRKLEIAAPAGGLGNILNLDELAKDQAYEFLFTVGPLLLRGGIGVPVNPIAIR